MKCFKCARKLGLVDTMIGGCLGCKHVFCMADKAQHEQQCEAFQTAKQRAEKELLAKRLADEATKTQKVEKL